MIILIIDGCVFFMLHPKQLARVMGMSAWSMVSMDGKGEWSCIGQEVGAQFVMIVGVILMRW